jgi:hypothetical protein
MKTRLKMKTSKNVTLRSIGITNGEYGQVIEIGSFLQWLRHDGAKIPEHVDGIEFDHLMARYLIYDRSMAMQRLVDEGVIPQDLADKMKQRWSDGRCYGKTETD